MHRQVSGSNEEELQQQYSFGTKSIQITPTNLQTIISESQNVDTADHILRSSSQHDLGMTFDFSGTVFKQQSSTSNFISNFKDQDKMMHAFENTKIIQYEETEVDEDDD